MNHNVDAKFFAHGGGRCLPTNSIVSKSLLTSIRKENKLASRQFKRLVELWLLSRIPAAARQVGTARLTRRAKTADEGDRAFYFWRLLVKQRIWNQNRDQLSELEPSDAVKHLEVTTDNLVDDYERLLASLAEKAMKGSVNDADGNETTTVVASRKRGKRNLVVEDDDDDDDDGGEKDGRAKRQKSVA